MPIIMKSYPFATVFSIFIIISSCQSHEKGRLDDVSQIFDYESMNNGGILKGVELDLGIILAPFRIFFKDSLLFISAIGLDDNLVVYNSRDSFKKIGGIIDYGQGPDEMLSVANMQFNDDSTFWAFDAVTFGMKKFRLVFINDSIHTSTVESIRIQGLSVLGAVVAKNKIVSTTTDINPLTRFYEYDMQGKRIGTTGSYPSYDREIPNTAAVEVFSGHIVSNPKSGKFLMAYDYTDLIEIYNNNSTLDKRIQGPHVFTPDFDLKQRGEYYFMQRMVEKTRIGYVSVKANEEEIMLLYGNGRLREKGKSEEGIHHKHIILMDWTGKPIRYFELDKAIASFAVDWNNRIIYGLEKIESKVFAFSF